MILKRLFRFGDPKRAPDVINLQFLLGTIHLLSEFDVRKPRIRLSEGTHFEQQF